MIHSHISHLEDSATYGDITLLETLSVGRFFRVVKARRSTKYVIVKTLITSDSMFKELLRREYELSRSLSHRSIVAATEFLDSTPFGPAIVMEYVEGMLLSDYLNGDVSMAERRAILGDIVDAVDYMHHRGILHNDLKPDNIIVTRNGTVRIIDFGLSISDDSLYRGCVGGSEGYSAPEVLRGEAPFGASSDIYSIGALMNLLFSKRRYRNLIERCCSEDASRRYQSIGQLRQAIARRDRRRYVVAALVAVVAIVIALIPVVSNVVEEARDRSLRQRVEPQMVQFYNVAQEKMSRQQYCEFAAQAKSEYMVNYLDFRATLDDECGRMCDEIFAEQMPLIDSMLLTLPSISTLPVEEQGKFIDMLNRNELP